MKFNKKRYRNIVRAEAMTVKDELKRKKEFLADHYDSLVKLSKCRKYIDKNGFVVADLSTF